ncbi:MAG: prohibitin family protein [Candidatus Electrothrix aestuarii]|uniref:Prohibitin family protein n=1 Tax=Candidatus Electrothrix aestuarii TaxID=3062594 RepID=A0AAU8LR55_9BACT|nr:prohibitin family protein [Candidatus Electrothrix aestuarii]
MFFKKKSHQSQRKATWWQRLCFSCRNKWPYWLLLSIGLGLLFFVFWKRIVIWIDTGEGGVLYRPLQGGTVTDQVFTEGVHLLMPYNRMTHYNTRIQIIRHEFDVLTNRGLPVNLKIAVRYRPIFELLGVLHQRVGPDYPNKIILPQIESVLRKGLGTHSPEEIYTNKNLLLTGLVRRAIEEIGRKFVIVDDIIIREVKLPPGVKKAIEDKLVEEQRFLSYNFRLQAEKQEAERKRIESGGIRDYAENIAATMSEKVLRWHGVQATLKLAESPNAKVVVIGGGKDGLPLVLNAGEWPGAGAASAEMTEKSSGAEEEQAKATNLARPAQANAAQPSVNRPETEQKAAQPLFPLPQNGN